MIKHIMIFYIFFIFLNGQAMEWFADADDGLRDEHTPLLVEVKPQKKTNKKELKILKRCMKTLPPEIQENIFTLVAYDLSLEELVHGFALYTELPSWAIQKISDGHQRYITGKSKEIAERYKNMRHIFRKKLRDEQEKLFSEVINFGEHENMYVRYNFKKVWSDLRKLNNDLRAYGCTFNSQKLAVRLHTYVDRTHEQEARFYELYSDVALLENYREMRSSFIDILGNRFIETISSRENALYYFSLVPRYGISVGSFAAGVVLLAFDYYSPPISSWIEVVLPAVGFLSTGLFVMFDSYFCGKKFNSKVPEKIFFKKLYHIDEITELLKAAQDQIAQIKVPSIENV